MGRDDSSLGRIGGSTDSKSPYPWVKNVPQASAPSAEEQAVFQFFEKYVMYPCNHGSSPGFLEQLPGLFAEVKSKGRVALRWAVRAAAYASLSNERDDPTVGNNAIQCYGRALSALAESLADISAAPDDHILMTVVVLDLFEVGSLTVLPLAHIHWLTPVGYILTGWSLKRIPCSRHGPNSSPSRTRSDLRSTRMESIPTITPSFG